MVLTSYLVERETQQVMKTLRQRIHNTVNIGLWSLVVVPDPVHVMKYHTTAYLQHLAQRQGKELPAVQLQAVLEQTLVTLQAHIQKLDTHPDRLRQALLQFIEKQSKLRITDQAMERLLEVLCVDIEKAADRMCQNSLYQLLERV